jgi:hypothetical protein
MKDWLVVLGAIVLGAVTGCARLVVLDPGVVRERNDVSWNIRPASTHPANVPSGGPALGVRPEASTADGVEAGGFTPAAGEAPTVTPVSPLPPAAPPVAVSSTKAREIPKAVLETPRDDYGIPQGLYQLDPMLGSYLEVMHGRTSSHRAAGAGAIALGVVAAGLAAVLFWRASVNADAVARAKANGQSVTSDPSGMQYAWGLTDGVLALGFLVGGIVEVATTSDPSALQRYSRETYGVPVP